MAAAATNRTEQAAARDPAPPPQMAANAPPASILDPRLLMAARHGDSERLKHLLRLNEEAAIAAAAARAQVVVEVDRPAAAPPTGAASLLQLLDGVTRNEGDSLLHVVAASGDGGEFLDCAEMIYGFNKDLLAKRNRKGDTPLHCAAAAGNAGMVFRLLGLDMADRDDTAMADRDDTLLRMQNVQRETALHLAIRAGDKTSVQIMINLDPELPCIPRAREQDDAPSPLYLAISLGEWSIADLMFHESRVEGSQSFYGPRGRNVLHEAASSAHVMRMLLEWFHWGWPTEDMQMATTSTTTASVAFFSQLASQRDWSGNTPLHLAASLEESPLVALISKLSSLGLISKLFGLTGSKSKITSLLLDADTSSVYQKNDKGWYPIHVATLAGRLDVIGTLLKKCPDCATLRDCKGRTFLHVAVESERNNVVKYVCGNPKLLSILNMQDDEGDTALHLAVKVGNRSIFNCLLRNPYVRLGVPNKEALRPRDLSQIKIPAAFYYSLNPIVLIQTSLEMMGAPFGGNQPRPMSESERRARNKALSKDLDSATQVMGVVSVLVATVTFASAFTLPGGYVQSASDGVPGTPLLAGSYAFDAFILADGLAFICSCLATFSLVFAGVPGADVRTRMNYMNMSYDFMRSSVRSMVVAFALGLYLVLAPVARKTAIAVCVIIGASFVHGNLEARQVYSATRTAIARWGTPIPAAWIRIAMSFFTGVLKPFLPLIIIFGFPAIWQTKKHHTS